MQFVRPPRRRPGASFLPGPSAKRVLALAIFALALILPMTSHAERPRVYALTGATVVTSPGQVLESAGVVVRDGRIEAVGTDVALPADAVEIDAAGMWIYAGLIDANSGLGLAAAGGSAGGGGPPGGRQGSSSSRKGAVHPLATVQAEKQVRDELQPFEGDRVREMTRLRDLGFGAVLATPSSGLLRGRSAAILLLQDRPVADLILDPDVAQHAAFERAGFGQGYPTSLMGSVAAMRQAMLDASRVSVWNARYEADPSGMARPTHHAALQALLPVVDGTQPIVIHTDNPDDTLLASRLAREFELDLVVAASGHEWEAAEQIAASGRRLILPIEFPDKPKVGEDDEALSVSVRTMRRYVEAPSGPGKLHEAGVTFALSARDVAASDFHKNLTKIVERGLPADVALAALTTVPAELLGLERVLGTVEPGKIANLVVTDGPLFAEKTTVRRVFVDGIDHEIEAKDKPKGDPNAVVDPRGSWAVSIEMGARTIERVWTITGAEGNFGGTAETRSGTVEFDEVTLAGNVLTVRLPGRGGRGATEISVIIDGETFAGTAEMGPGTVELEGTRTAGPEGGAR